MSPRVARKTAAAKRRSAAVRTSARASAPEAKKYDSAPTVAVVGLGYVGLPLAVAFGVSGTPTIGFDINATRVAALRSGRDETGELSEAEISGSAVRFTDDPTVLREATFVVVAVPTPVTRSNQPDLALLEKASALVGGQLRPGMTVIFESTVYPGVTEEVCLPILERVSGLTAGTDFKVGYSPERINPGDREHTLAKVVKVVSGMDAESTAAIADLYRRVCLAGVHVAPNIKTAEAAKVIENTQRDLNIALMNELSLIFHRVGIETRDVLEAAGTKWNFLKFSPGLVGGHCIGVDPYYLVQKAEELGYHPQVIAAGRRVNDGMPEFVADQVVTGLIAQGVPVQGAEVLVMGLTFKENVRDLRNSKIAGTIERLRSLGVVVSGHDPLLSEEEIIRAFKVPVIADLSAASAQGRYAAVIVATPHRQFEGREEAVLNLMRRPFVFDIRGAFPALRAKEGVRYASL